jgi:PAS domain S-box-containing protein
MFSPTERSGYILETLRDGGEFILYRGRQHGNAVLVVALASEHASPSSLRRLEHEYSLAAELDPAWAAQPLALTRHKGRTTLVLKDPGGEPLDRVLERGQGQPLELTRFLRVAVGLATALGQVHRHGLIHKEIKPANALVDDAGNVWLTGFGIASRLPRERQPPAPPDVIAGTLAYMAPEQTGRMNRSIDARSDLYSLGVTLYQMLTGHLPFTATDALEWVHSHIARQPAPLDGSAKGPLSAIIMRLLAKTAEERYQTAASLEADLRRCLAEWESQGRIHPFPLGAHDVSDQLLIPERLYGRELEIEALLAAFDRVVAHGTAELVLLSGYSGIGKSSIVNELHKGLPRGLFAAGKFDQYKRDIPYATLAQAFQTLIHQILEEKEPAIAQWREALQEALGPNGELIVTLIPELEVVVGKQPPVPSLPPQDAQNRFQAVLRRFLGVFARPEHLLVLFLDDLQWLDAATLELIEALITQRDVPHLLLVGAYRNNEVGASHPLMRTLDAIRKGGAKVQDIVLAPLALADVGRLVADALHCERGSAYPLAQLVHEKSGGNPFFAIQFLTSLVDEGLLAFDRAAAAWTWDMDRIRTKGYTHNVVDLVAGKLHRLPGATQEVLRQLACLGNAADLATLTLVHGGPEDAIDAALWAAVRAGLVFRVDNTYTFLHDRVQEAAYGAIPEAERAAAHLRIGRLLASRTVPGDLEEKIFDIVNHLNRGAALITSPDEREWVAGFNLMAAKRAKRSTAYASALAYLAAGRALLAEDSWERQYALTSQLELHRAECEFLTGDLAAAEERLSMLSQRGGNLVDAGDVACLRVTLYTTLDQSDRSIEVGLDYLRRLGIDWSPHPTRDEVRQEYEQLWRQLGSREIEGLVGLPEMSDPDWCAALGVLTALQAPARFTDWNLLALVVGRVANLSLPHGNNDASCLAYLWVGVVLVREFDDYQAGFHFGKLGFDLVEKQGLDRFKARVYLGFACWANLWARHARTSLDLVRRAFAIAQETGDLTYAAYSCDSMVMILLATGDPLGEVQREAENGLEFARKARFGLVTHIITGQLGLIRTLRGLTADFGSFNDADFDESSFERHLDTDPRLALAKCWYWNLKLQARFYAGDYGSALAAASEVEALLYIGPEFFELAAYHFYGALLRAALHDAASADERPQHLEALMGHYQQIKVWAENCPENFENRAALVAAEVARIEGRKLEAMRLYEQAILSARENDFIQNEALANELAARFYRAHGYETCAYAHLRNARDCYLRWGALGKVKQLDKVYPDLRRGQAPTSSTAAIDTLADQLDLGTVVKAAQAVSSEIVLDKLIEKLMAIAVEHAGAERGFLILLRNEAPQIEAEASSGRGRVEVTVRHAPVTPSDLPQSVLQYVIRTRESVVLDDASVRNLYSEDEYVRQKRPRSVLCLPIVKQTKLVGALYLENNLTPRAFTPDRVAVLELLASQAAISLDNARLFSDLQRSEVFLAKGQSTSHTGSFAWSVQSGEISWSEETFRIFEFDLIASPSLELALQRIHPDDRALLRQNRDRASSKGIDFEADYRLLMSDGRVKHIHALAHPQRDPAGNLEYLGAVMDVTAAKQAEEKIAQSERELRQLIDVIPQQVFVFDSDWNPLFANRRELEYTGLSLEEVHSKDAVARIFHSEDLKRLENLRERMSSEGAPFELEARIRGKDGKHRWFLIRDNPLLDEQGRVLRWYGTRTDIEDRKCAEMSLAGEKRLLEMIARGDSLDVILDTLCRLVEDLAAGSLSSILLLDSSGRRLRHGAAPSLPIEYMRAIDDALIGPSAGSCGTAAYHAQQVIVSDIATDPLWADYRDLALPHGLRACWSTPILSSAGKVLGTFATYYREPRSPSPQESNVIEQVTHLASIAIEREQAEEALRSSEQQWRDVFENNPTMYFMVDANGTVMAVNPFGAEQLGYTVDELVGQPVLSVFYESDRDEAQRNVALCLNQLGQSMGWELRKVRKDGSMLWVSETGRAVLRGTDRVVLIACEDITERRSAEEKIRQQELELRQILDLTPQHVAVLEPDRSRHLSEAGLNINQAALDYHGVTIEEWHRSDPSRFVHPDDWERFQNEDQIKFEQGSPFESEVRLLRSDGQYRWFLFRHNPMRDEQGRITRWYVAGTDIEDRKQAEQRLQNENVALREEIDKASMFEEIVGNSLALQTVLSRLSKVAPTGSSVLITGETGTGKELVARAIHRHSHRSSHAFVSVNCSAIPSDLIASELFGHEKGAFTGATQRRVGRFELAEGGTIFLDEIGELPAETQIALLRVLQEHEFERVGGTGSIRTDVRVIAATNRDLQASIAEGGFRSDLFYRLNVFPIEMPPLRERKEDIPLLVEYFIDRYARKAGKSFQTVDKRSLELLQSYPWPGNIRELQNIIERSVIVCETENFSVDESWLSRQALATEPGSQLELSEKLAAQEKELIEDALRETGGRVSGPSGAAAKLGMPRSTLESKVRSLKINKNRFRTAHPSRNN